MAFENFQGFGRHFRPGAVAGNDGEIQCVHRIMRRLSITKKSRHGAKQRRLRNRKQCDFSRTVGGSQAADRFAFVVQVSQLQHPLTTALSRRGSHDVSSD